jgi:hypothetical protein
LIIKSCLRLAQGTGRKAQGKEFNIIPSGLLRAVIPAKAGIQKFKLDAGSGPE